MIGSYSEEIPHRTATEMISGCGPGASVPPGTPQQGVRGHVIEKPEVYRRIARAHQHLADLYNQLADKI